MARKRLSHFDSRGQARMVDVGAKAETHRVARASGRINMLRATLVQVASGSASKGDVLVWRASPASRLPTHGRYHSALSSAGPPRVDVDHAAPITPRGRCCHGGDDRNAGSRWGSHRCHRCVVTIYDMCKSVDRAMHLERIQLLEKKGGKSGHWLAPKRRQTR
jgi:cyclic pyranopterin phosphate synthase